MRQHGKKWPLSAGPAYWDEMVEDERMCWRAGFEEYHRETLRAQASRTDRESARIWIARNSIDDLLGDQEDVDEAIEDLAALLGNVSAQRRESDPKGPWYPAGARVQAMGEGTAGVVAEARTVHQVRIRYPSGVTGSWWETHLVEPAPSSSPDAEGGKSQ